MHDFGEKRYPLAAPMLMRFFLTIHREGAMANGISVHLGINEVDPNHYQGWSGPLNACEADADDMQALASELGYANTLLKTREATRDRVIGAIRSAAETLQSGDIFFLSYSGHGGQVPDRNGDEVDLNDETWCLYDGQLIDDELRMLWSSFGDGVRILILSDSCHSGTVSRAPTTLPAAPSGFEAANLGVEGAAYRFMPTEAAARTYRTNRNFYDEIQRNIPAQMPPLKARVRLLSGCQDNQLSLDGTFNGLFTGQLLRVWSSGRFKGDYAQFHRAILDSMPATQSPNHDVFGVENTSFDQQKPFTINDIHVPSTGAESRSRAQSARALGVSPRPWLDTTEWETYQLYTIHEAPNKKKGAWIDSDRVIHYLEWDPSSEYEHYDEDRKVWYALPINL